MRAMVAEAMAAGAAGLSSSAAPTHLDLDDRPVPSRLAEPRRVRWRSPRRPAAAARARSRSCPPSAIGGIDADDEDYLIRLGAVSGLPVVIQGLGGRNKTDAPTATWEAAQSFLDRATEAGAPVYSMLIARPFDRPIVIDETNFHYLAVPSWNRMLQLPHAERVALPARPRDARRAARRGRALQPRSRARARPSRRRCGAHVYVDDVAEPEHDEARSRARSPTSPTSAASRRPTSLLDLALVGGPRHPVPLADREPRVGRGRRRGAARRAHDRRHLRRRCAPGPRRRRRLELVLPPLLGARPPGLDAGGGHPPDHRRCPPHCSASSTAACSRPGAPADLMVFDPETIGPWKKEFVHDLPGGVGRFKAWGRGVARHHRQRRADRARRRAHRAPPRPGGAPGVASR